MVVLAESLMQMRYVFIGDPAEGTVAVGQAHRGIQSVVVIVLPPLATESVELGDVGNVHTCDALLEAVDESRWQSGQSQWLRRPDGKADSEHVSIPQCVPHTWYGSLETGVLYRQYQRKQG